MRECWHHRLERSTSASSWNICLRKQDFVFEFIAIWSLGHVRLCDPMDYTIHGILQGRILEWVAMPSFRQSSPPRDWTQSPTLQKDSLPAEPLREVQEYWSGWPMPSPGDLPDPGIKPGSPALQADSLPADLWGKHHVPVSTPTIHWRNAFILDWYDNKNLLLYLLNKETQFSRDYSQSVGYLPLHYQVYSFNKSSNPFLGVFPLLSLCFQAKGGSEINTSFASFTLS